MEETMTTELKAKYRYENVKVLRVLDGDTVELEIDMGNNIRWTDKFRLYGIDTPEVHGSTKAAGDAATEKLKSLLENGILSAETFKPDKYGRWLVRLTVIVDAYPTYVSDAMINAGHARPYFGGTK
jgi:micrococcal nuclease